VIAISAHNIEADDEKYKHAGCDAFVAKPIDINELMQKISELLATTS
jgi:CheY-like chemotaxis protein